MSCVLVSPVLADGPPHTPEDLGLSAHVLTTAQGKVEYYVSAEAARPGAKKPLFIFLQGSGPAPIFSVHQQSQRKVVVSSLLIAPKMVRDNFHYAVLSKPGIPFLVEGELTPPAEYWRRTSLPARAEAVNAVIAELMKQPGVDATRLVVAGHSEGAVVAARVAATNPRVTDVVFLSGPGQSQMYDFLLAVRKRMTRSELTPEEAEIETQKLLQQYREIYADPTAIDKKWKGESYLRWATFFEPAVDDLVKSNARIFAGIGTADTSTPVESVDVIPIEFLRRGKHNLTYRTWPGLDHSYAREVISANGLRQREDHSHEVLAEVMTWLLEPKDAH